MMLEMLASPAQRRHAREFAELLDGQRDAREHELRPLVDLAATLRPAHLEPRADFAADLRARLVAETGRRPAAAVAVPKRTRPVPSSPPRLRRAVAAATVTALVAGAGAAVASSRAMPGDALYELKRGIESAQLSLAGSDLSRGRELLEQADHRLTEAKRLAMSGAGSDAETRDRISLALGDMESSLRQGADTLQGSYRKTGDVKPLQVLDGFVVEQQRRLAGLITVLDGMGQPAAALQAEAQRIADLLASLSVETTGVLPTDPAAAVAPAAGSGGRPGAAVRDGWAVSRSAAAGDPTTAGTSAGPAAAAANGSEAPAPGSTARPKPGGKIVDGVTGTLRDGAGRLGGSGGPTAAGVPSVRVPLPTVPVPLPVPLPGATVAPATQLDVPCVPVAGITTC